MILIVHIQSLNKSINHYSVHIESLSTSLITTEMGSQTICQQCETLEPSGDYHSSEAASARPALKQPSSPHLTPLQITCTEGGKTRIVSEQGIAYEGETKDRMKDGMGKMSWPSGSYYEGGWQKDSPLGYGTYYHGPSGNSYSGIFKDH